MPLQLIVHRNVVDEEEGNNCEVIVRSSSTEDDEPDRSDPNAERLEDLEHDVATLQECLEVAEAHVDKVLIRAVFFCFRNEITIHAPYQLESS